METSALRPRILALQGKGTASVRRAKGLRPARVASIFFGRRTCLPRNKVAASVAAADVEAPEVASAEQTDPAQGARPAGAGTNGGTRRREGGPRRQRRLETKYKVEDLVVGQEVDGVVGSTTAFGAFVDIGMGSKDALLHISHMADGFVSDIAEHVQVGMQIKARVINVDPGTNKVGLTMRSPESEEARVERQARRAERSERFGGGGERAEPGDRGQAPVQARMRRAPKERKDIKFPAVGEEIQGSVEGVQNYGVFVKISDDIKAMLHGSEMATKDGREPDIRATFSIGDAIKVRVLKVDAKNRRVDVTQRSEEEIEADRTLNEKGASTARVSGMNTLQAALARAGIRKQDFEDLSKAPEESSTAEPSPAAAPAADMSPEAAAVEAEPAAEPSPVAAAEPEVTAAQEPATEPEEEEATPAPAEDAKPQAAAAAEAEVISPPMEGIATPTGDNAAPVLDEPQGVSEPAGSDTAPVAEEAAPQPKPATAPAIAEAMPEVAEPEATPEVAEPEVAAEVAPEVAAEVPAAPEAMPEPSQPEAAPIAEEPLQASAAPEEPKEELSPEAFPAAEAASSSAAAGVEAAPADPEPSQETSSTEAVSAASTAPEPAPAAFKVDAKAAKALRDQTGAGMMDAKKALMETRGDAAAAVEWLRKKGLSGADKKAGRIASEGVIASYIHAGSRLGVLVELNCETDFVARGDKFKELVSDMAMQIAASGEVTVISVDDVPADVKQKEFDIEMGKEDIQSKPENIRPKIVEGRVAKTFKTMALLEQAFIKDTDKDVASVIKEATAALGEKIQVRRFEKFVLGEGIEKKTNDLAKEVEAQTKAMTEAAKKAAAPADSAASPSEAAAEPAQVKIDAKAVKQLRQASGAGMMDAKKALIETGGDVDKAMEFLRKKGLASADKKAGRLASEGAIGAYIHAGSRLGVLVEVNCETDFVARGPQFKELVQDMAMQIAASAGVDIVAIEDAPQEELERERAIEMQKEDIQAKPENIRGKIVDGRVQKIFKERALLEQAFIKDTSKTVAEHIKAQVATIGENIQVRRFARFVLGEGIEKKQENFAEEIAAATGQS